MRYFFLLLTILLPCSSLVAQDSTTYRKNAFQLSLGLGVMDAKDVNRSIEMMTQGMHLISGNRKMLAAWFLEVHQSIFLSDKIYIQPEYSFSQGYKRFETMGRGPEGWTTFSLNRNTFALLGGFRPGGGKFFAEGGPTYSSARFKQMPEAKDKGFGAKLTLGQTMYMKKTGFDTFLSLEYCHLKEMYGAESYTIGFSNIRTGIRLRIPTGT